MAKAESTAAAGAQGALISRSVPAESRRDKAQGHRTEDAGQCAEGAVLRIDGGINGDARTQTEAGKATSIAVMPPQTSPE